MATRTNGKGNRPTSPTKKSQTQLNANASRSQYELGPDGDYSAMMNDRDLVRGLTEREVEIDHLKTTVIALNE
jgi:hypothetical protein